MKITNYSSEQEKIDYEIDSNPELQKSELAPENKDACWHEKIYKTLATVGDFKCYVWYYNKNYDPLQVNEGTKRIHIVGSEQRIEDHIEINKYLGISDLAFSDGVIFVNAIIRLNGTTYQNNKDLKDCVKYMSGVANHYEASKDKIFAIDPLDDDKMYEMNYDVSSAKTYSDVSNNSLGDFTTGTIGNGSLSTSYSTVFASGAISFTAIKNAFGSDNNIDKFHRGENIADINENSNVPTSGEISFSDFRNAANGIVANANGNWMHLQARWEVFGDSAWTSNISKTLNITGNAGPADSSSPAVRINSGGQGEITLNVTLGGSTVRGWPGEGGTGGASSQSGQSGNIAMVVSSPIKMPTSHYNGRVKGGGGGGGGGGKGGQGGSGGHNGGRRCTGRFCWGSRQYCNNDGGSGGAGGNGGAGGRGDGYYYDYSNQWWVATHQAGLAGGAGGGAGASGSGRAGQGGTGGTGGQGGGFESSGSTGGQGGTGNTGAGQYGSCGVGGDGSRIGDAGQGGKSGGSNSGKISTSNNGNVSLT